MRKLMFDVVGSTGTVYTVAASVHEGKVRVTCTCEAGNNGVACKHRLMLLTDKSDAPEVAELQSWLPGTELAQRMADVARAEADADAARKRLAAAKKALGRVMNGT